MFEKADILDEIQLDVGSVSIKTNNILYVEYSSDADIDAENVITVGQAICKLCKGEPKLFIVDVRNCYGNYSPEAREYMAKNPEINKVRKAFAILSNGLGTRLLANFYLKINKPLSPGKLFNSEEKAIEWLKQYE